MQASDDVDGAVMIRRVYCAAVAPVVFNQRHIKIPAFAFRADGFDHQYAARTIGSGGAR